MRAIAALTGLLAISAFCFAQGEGGESPGVKVSAAVEGYWAYDSNAPDEGARNPNFAFQHPEHNQIGVNLATLGASYEGESYRGVVSLVFGDYAEANYAAEPVAYRHFNELYAGVRFAEGLWLDVGVMNSHIGIASIDPTENWTVTRSFISNATPYYSAGARLGYQATDELYLALHVLNGWQNIDENNDQKAIGTQIAYSSGGVSVNSSTFFGEGYNDPSQEFIRYFHHFSVKYDPEGSKTSVVFGIDTGWEERAEGESGTDDWLGLALIGRQELSERWALATRFEYFDDEVGVAIPSLNPVRAQGFQATGVSLNFDFMPQPGAMLRFEGKYLFSDKDRFLEGYGPLGVPQVTGDSFLFTVSLAASFEGEVKM